MNQQDFQAGVDYDGIVKFWNEKKGFGFVMIPGLPEVFCHVSSIKGGAKELQEGQAVKIGVEKCDRGWRASEVLPV